MSEEVEQHLETARRQAREFQEQLDRARPRVEPPPPPPPPPPATSGSRPELAPPPAQVVVPTETPAVTPAPVVEAAGAELVPGEEKPKKGMAVVTASVQPKTPQERLLHHLQQSAAVKGAVEEALGEMGPEVIDPNLRIALGDQRALTGRQRQELEARLRELG